MKQCLGLLTAVLLLHASASAQVPPPPPPLDATSVDTTLFTRVEQEAEFPGGPDAWRSYLMKNLDADAAGRDVPPKAKSFRQTAVVRFLIDRDGSILEAEVVNKVIPSIRKEALRVILGSGKWIPARQNG